MSRDGGPDPGGLEIEGSVCDWLPTIAGLTNHDSPVRRIRHKILEKAYPDRTRWNAKTERERSFRP